MSRTALASVVVGLAAAIAGCGGSAHRAEMPTTTTSATSATSASGLTALQAEANAAAAGDIPDNQVFLVFRNTRAGYSMKYPEGWAQQGSGATVVFRDKNNIVRIDVRRGRLPTGAAIREELRGLNGARVVSAPQAIQLSGGRGYKVVYSTESAPNAVTGKRVTLVVDRYYLVRAGRLAVIDLGTPQDVDNVDAYRLMIESFRWR
jgi:type IV secretory pathway protease TraF